MKPLWSAKAQGVWRILVFRGRLREGDCRFTSKWRLNEWWWWGGRVPLVDSEMFGSDRLRR